MDLLLKSILDKLCTLYNKTTMDIVKLNVETREAGKTKSLRKKDMIPAVFYGLKHKNRHLAMDYQTFRRTYKESGTNTVLELNIDDKDKVNVLIQDIQYDPVTDRFAHVDFVFVNLDKEVTTEIPLVFTGESPAVKDLGGTLMDSRDTVTVKCIARNIPKQIEVDVSSITDFSSSIHIGDLKLPEGSTLVDDPDLTVVTAIAQREEEEEEIPEEEVEAEVIGEEKEEGEKAEGEEGKEEGKEAEKAEKEEEKK